MHDSVSIVATRTSGADQSDSMPVRACQEGGTVRLSEMIPGVDGPVVFYFGP